MPLVPSRIGVTPTPKLSTRGDHRERVLATFAVLNGYDPDEIRTYDEALELFYARYEEFLRLNHLHALATARSFEIELPRVNDGSLPAETSMCCAACRTASR